MTLRKAQPRFHALGGITRLTEHLDRIGLKGCWRSRPGDPHQQYDLRGAIINFWPHTGTLTVQNDYGRRVTRILIAKGRPKIFYVPAQKRRRHLKPYGFFQEEIAP